MEATDVTIKYFRLCRLVRALCVSCLALAAYTVVTAAQDADGGQDVGQAANDPTAPLTALQFSDWYTVDFHTLGFHQLDDESDNTLVFRPVIPFKTGDLQHIFRATVPFITDSPFLENGLSDITIFDLVVFSESWGRWGVGAVALLPTGGETRGAEQWGLGPAVGFTARSGHVLWGLFNQNIFTVAGDDERVDVNVSLIQPILSIGLGGGWSVGFSEMSITYDWEADRFSNLPLGINIAKLVRFDQMPVQFSAQYEHNFADDEIAAADTVRFTVKLILP